MEQRGLPSLISSHEEEGKENIASDIIQLVGWTPLIELKKIVENDQLCIRLVAKLESYQPLCSVKDRGALRMIEDAEEKELIKPGFTTLAAPTSGNLGISLAFIGIRKGYKFIAIMPANYSVERRILLRHLGAQVILTDPKLGIKGIFDTADQLKEKDPNIYILDQTTNPANPEAHFLSTGAYFLSFFALAMIISNL